MQVNRNNSLMILILAISLSGNMLLAAKNNQPDVILVSEFNPPYVYTNKEGEYVGSAIEYLVPILNNAKLSFELKIAPWNRAMSLTMKNSNVLIYPIARIPERENNFNWLIPLHSMNFKLFGLADKVDVSLNDATSGKYKFVCANHTIQCLGLNKLGIPDNSIVKIAHVDDIQMSQMVLRGRVDFMLITESGLHHQLNELNMEPKSFIALDNYTYEVVEYLASNKAFDKSLTERLLESVEQLSADEK